AIVFHGRAVRGRRRDDGARDPRSPAQARSRAAHGGLRASRFANRRGLLRSCPASEPDPDRGRAGRHHADAGKSRTHLWRTAGARRRPHRACRRRAAVTFFEGMLPRLLDVLTFQAGYNANTVIAGTAVLGAAAGVVGTFVFLRGRALISDALSHATLPGIALAFLAGTLIGIETRSLPLLLAGATITGLIGVAAMHALTRLPRVTEDSAIGAILGSFFGLGVVLLSYVQSLPVAGQAGLHHFLLGQAAAMARSEAIAIAALAAAALLLVLLFFKEFRLVAFDRDFAAGLGWPVTRIDLAMAGLGVAVTVIGLQTVGLVMIVALLVVPPVAARFWSNDVRIVALLAGIFGALSAYIGAAASYALSDMPTGAAIVLAAGAFAITGLLFAPRRGVVGVA